MAVNPGGPMATPACTAGSAQRAWAELVSGGGQVLWRVRLPATASADASAAPYVQPVAIGGPGGGAGTAVLADGDTVYGLSASGGRQLWRWSAGQPVYNVWAWQGTAVVLSGQVGRHAELAGIDAASGAVRWALPLGGNGLYGSQALTGDGGLAMLSPDGTLEVADLATGHVRWSRQPGGAAPAPQPTPEPAAQQEGLASPVAVGSVVVDAAGGRAIGYDARTGAVAWTAGGLPVAPLLRAAAGLVLATSAAVGPGMPTAVTALVPSTGRVAWRFDSGAAATVEGDGPAGIAAATSVPDALYLIDPATGRARWRASTFVDDPVPLITASDVIMPEGRQGQRIVDRSASSGAVRWSAPVTGLAPPSMPVLRAGSRAVTAIDPSGAGNGGALSALDLATGRPAWRVPLPAVLFVPPALAPGGDVLAEPADLAQACPLGGAGFARPAVARAAGTTAVPAKVVAPTPT